MKKTRHRDWPFFRLWLWNEAACSFITGAGAALPLGIEILT